MYEIYTQVIMYWDHHVIYQSVFKKNIWSEKVHVPDSRLNV